VKIKILGHSVKLNVITRQQNIVILPEPTNVLYIFFWSSGIMDCMLFTFGKRVPLMRYGASVVLHLSLSLMNSFNKTDGAFSRAGYAFRGLSSVLLS